MKNINTNIVLAALILISLVAILIMDIRDGQTKKIVLGLATVVLYTISLVLEYKRLNK